MKLSYLITCHNEEISLLNCLNTIEKWKCSEDEVLVLDDFSDNPKTKEILKNYQTKGGRVIQHALERNYGCHKNFGNEQCSGDWMFQIDGDEIPNPNLIVNIKDIILANPNVELIYVPRINDFIGVTEKHARQWGWKLDYKYDGRPIVNFPDFQGRVYKREPERIRWDRRLHEKIEGHRGYATLPADMDLALYHDKTIEKQMATNKRYNEWFTQEENMGHDVFSSKATS